MHAPDLSAFGAVSLLHPLAGGARAEVWRVERDGVALVAKSTRRSEAALRWLEGPQALARAAGFVVPGLIASGDGSLAPTGWTLEHFIEGRPAPEAAMPALLPGLQALHRTGAHLPQRPGFASVRDLMAQDTGGDVDLSAMPADLVAACRNAWRALTGAETAIHGDITAANVILTAAGPALIDWDEARRDLPQFDTLACRTPSPAQVRAQLAWEVACGWTREAPRATALAARLL